MPTDEPSRKGGNDTFQGTVHSGHSGLRGTSRQPLQVTRKVPGEPASGGHRPGRDRYSGWLTWRSSLLPEAVGAGNAQTQKQELRVPPRAEAGPRSPQARQVRPGPFSSGHKCLRHAGRGPAPHLQRDGECSPRGRAERMGSTRQHSPLPSPNRTCTAAGGIVPKSGCWGHRANSWLL